MTDGSEPTRGHTVGGRYLLEERLGRGGMSTVWKARDQVLDRDVAVKIVADVENPEVTAERFRREARATAALNHPNIVTLFDAGVDEGRAFLVMELLPGRTLADELRTRGALPIEEVREIAVQVSGALGAAHAAGLVHRDIKPGNIALTADGGIKVLDFGITHIIDEGAAGASHPLTVTGAVVGTAAYVAPEQARGERVDGRADLYALGCVLYALLTGKPPFRGTTAVNTMMLHATEPAPDVQDARPDVPAGLAAVVAAMLRKDPQERPQSAEDVAGAIRAETAEEVTTFLPAPVGDEDTTVVPGAALPAPTRAYPADHPGPQMAAPLPPARAAVDPPVAAPTAVDPDEPEELFPMEEDEEDNRKGLLIGLVVLAVLLVGGFGWWILTRDTGLSADPAPTAAVPTTPSASPTPEEQTPEPTVTSTDNPLLESPSAVPVDESTLTASPDPELPPETEPATQAPPPPPPATTQAPPPATTQAPPPATTLAPPPPPPPAANPGDAAQAVQAAADRLSSAVQDATTGGGMDKKHRKDIDSALRDLSKALRNGDDQKASDALSAVDQELSDSGYKNQLNALYEDLKNLVDAWKAAL